MGTPDRADSDGVPAIWLSWAEIVPNGYLGAERLVIETLRAQNAV